MTFMKGTTLWGNFAVAAGLALVWFTGPLAAETSRLDQLFADLAGADAADAPYLEAEIRRLWSQSGSAAADLLYSRAERAIEAGDYATALGHSSALTDHAPDFAAGHALHAVALFHTGRAGPAIAALQRALVLEPREFDALSGLGVILMETGQNDRARAVFAEVLRLNPHMKDIAALIAEIDKSTRGTAL